MSSNLIKHPTVIMNQKVWFTSDTHYHHKNIVRGTCDWEDKTGCRNFDTLEQHDKTLIDVINTYVGKDDILYHLGDWSFGGFDKIKEFRDKLSCKTIHLIIGNHDHHIESDREGIRSLFASVQHYKEITVYGTKIVLCHYAFRVWNHSHKGSWMLYGHSHNTLDAMRPEFSNPTWIGDQYYVKNWRTMDVGVDTNNMKPYEYHEINSVFAKRDVLLGVDRHGSRGE